MLMFAVKHLKIVYIYLYACLFIFGASIHIVLHHKRHRRKNTNQNDEMEQKKTHTKKAERTNIKLLPFSIFGVSFFAVLLSRRARCGKNSMGARNCHTFQTITESRERKKQQQIFVSCQWNDPSF